MKKYPLSTSSERAAGITFSIIMIVLFGVLLFALRGNTSLLIVAICCVAPVSAVLILYVLNVAKAVVIYEPQNRQLKVMGFRERTIDLNGVAILQTIPVKSGHVEGRSLAFADENGSIMAVVPTYFTSNRGYLAEPMAEALAFDLGLKFNETVPKWEYDKEARKAHDLEVEKQQKEDARKRREAKALIRQEKIRARANDIRNENEE